MRVRVVGKSRGCLADAQESRAVELNGCRGCRRDSQQYQSTFGMLDGLERERNVRSQVLRPPEFQWLLPRLGGGGVEFGAGDRMVAVAYSPDDVAGLSVCDAGGVCQCGNQPPDTAGFDIVLLEFGPGDLCGQGAQLVYQGDGAGIGHGPVAQGCMI